MVQGSGFRVFRVLHELVTTDFRIWHHLAQGVLMLDRRNIEEDPDSPTEPACVQSVFRHRLAPHLSHESIQNRFVNRDNNAQYKGHQYGWVGNFGESVSPKALTPNSSRLRSIRN